MGKVNFKGAFPQCRQTVIDEPAPMSDTPRFIVDQRGHDCFAVLGKNPDAGKDCVSYRGQYLTLCTMEGRAEAVLVADALNAFPAAQAWPEEMASAERRRA